MVLLYGDWNQAFALQWTISKCLPVEAVFPVAIQNYSNHGKNIDLEPNKAQFNFKINILKTCFWKRPKPESFNRTKKFEPI